MATDRPLHPDDAPHVFNHPISGCVHYMGPDYQSVHVHEYMKGGDEQDVHIQQGQKVHRRLEMGQFYEKTQPEPIKRMIHQQFIDQVYPLEFEGDTPETQQLLERVDMATSVMEAGGACTICGDEPDEDGVIDHKVGCEWVSWLLHQALKAAGEDGEPSLRTVVKRAYAQIERMQ